MLRVKVKHKIVSLGHKLRIALPPGSPACGGVDEFTCRLWFGDTIWLILKCSVSVYVCQGCFTISVPNVTLLWS